MRGRLIRIEPGNYGRQRLVIEIGCDYREQFDALQGALLDVQIKRYVPRRSLQANAYFHALAGQIAAEIGSTLDEVKRQLVVDYGTLCTDRNGNVVAMTLPDDADPDDYYPYTRCVSATEKDGKTYRCYIAYKHTADMDSREMSRLIDGARWEARELSLPP